MLKKWEHSIFQGGRTLIPPVTNLTVSALVVYWYSSDLWGGFINGLILVHFLSFLLMWGHKEPLMRRFSKNSGKIGAIWWKWLSSRSLLIGVAFLLLALFNDQKGVFEILFLIQVLHFFTHSFLPLLFFKQVFKQAFWVELISSIVYLVGVVIWKEQLSVEALLLLYGIHVLLKGLAYALLFWQEVKQVSFTFDQSVFKEGFPFLLTNLVGYLYMRVDVLFIRQFFDTGILGEYHIITNFLIQAVGLLMVFDAPIQKYIYRFTQKNYETLIIRAVGVGVLISTVVSLTLPFVLSIFYEIMVSKMMGFSFGFYVWASFVNFPIVYWFYKRRKEKWMLWMNCLGVVFHVIALSFVWEVASVETLIYAMTISKVTLTAVYFFLYLRCKRAWIQR